MTRVEDGNANPARSHATPTEITQRRDPMYPPLEENKSSIHTITVPDTAINFEFGESTYSLWLRPSCPRPCRTTPHSSASLESKKWRPL